MNILVAGLNDSAKLIHEQNKAKGFWDSERNVGELLMLVTSELGEGMEAHRKGKFADWDAYDRTIKSIPNISTDAEILSDKNHAFKSYVKDTFEDEIADAVIRLLDMAAGLGIDLEKQINEKVAYNKSRERLHGKLY